MTPHRLIMGRKLTILEEAVHQTFGAQPVSCDLARNEPDFVQALKNFFDISLADMADKLGYAGRGYLLDVIAEKAPLVYVCLKEPESSSDGKVELLAKFIPTFRALRELLR